MPPKRTILPPLLAVSKLHSKALPMEESSTMQTLSDIQNAISKGNINLINESEKIQEQIAPEVNAEEISHVTIKRADSVMPKEAEKVKITRARRKPVVGVVAEVQKEKEPPVEVSISDLWFDPANPLKRVEIDKIEGVVQDKPRNERYLLTDLKEIVANNPEVFKGISPNKKLKDLANIILARLRDIGFIKD